LLRGVFSTSFFFFLDSLGGCFFFLGFCLFVCWGRGGGGDCMLLPRIEHDCITKL